MISVEQCRINAEKYKALASDPSNSARRCTVLKNISRSWTALAHQLENLDVIDKSEAGSRLVSPGV
ncbi:hypothetical protein [Bradyrhizobium sp. AUGA SZCCT0182]|uniref:hypothetical protein n=1 Tax=Bradyrhizobium sp. AUGA SZCCT0182 TaxID=2807667 RepID=UPI001BA7FE23|nr:hypothetical protein [Bradyrhizobium sp. AUGA SZCCT0182]MBR1237874.1 hypothetical protein [Bradyrhizobium sp. AUGA SZCCT0182]